MVAYARDVTETCPGPWDLVIGHSLGGAVAVAVATELPGFAESLLLVDPAIDLSPAEHTPARERLVAEAADPPSVADLLAANPRVGDPRRTPQA